MSLKSQYDKKTQVKYAAEIAFSAVNGLGKGDCDGWIDVSEFLGKRFTYGQYCELAHALWNQDVDIIGIDTEFVGYERKKICAKIDAILAAQMNDGRHCVWELVHDEKGIWLCRAGKSVFDSTFAFYQIVYSLTEMRYIIQFSIVNMEKVAQEDVNIVLRKAGYRNMEDFVRETATSDEWVYRNDGSLDEENSPAYIIDYELLARILFEENLCPASIDDKRFRKLRNAVKYVNQQTL
ncbi:MAG: hypothetical protein RR415_05775 [Ruthenibacterium sp.]